SRVRIDQGSSDAAYSAAAGKNQALAKGRRGLRGDMRVSVRSGRVPAPLRESAAGEQGLATLHGGADLIRRGAPDVVAGVHRAFQGQHGEHVVVDLIAELAQLRSEEHTSELQSRENL